MGCALVGYFVCVCGCSHCYVVVVSLLEIVVVVVGVVVVVVLPSEVVVVVVEVVEVVVPSLCPVGLRGEGIVCGKDKYTCYIKKKQIVEVMKNLSRLERF